MEHDREPVEAGDPSEKPGQITEEALQIPVRRRGVRHVEQHPVEITRRARAMIGACLAHHRISHPPEVFESMSRMAVNVAGRSGRIHSPRRGWGDRGFRLGAETIEGTTYARQVASQGERVVVDVAGREVAISNPSKVYFPEARITKLEVVRYYLAVAEGALGGRPAQRAGPLRQRDPRRLLLPEAGARLAADLDRSRRTTLPLRPRGRGSRATRRSRAGLDGEPGMPGAPPAPGPCGGPRASRRAPHRPRPDAGHRVAPDPRRGPGGPGGPGRPRFGG